MSAKKILTIFPESEDSKALSKIIEDEGFLQITADSGAEALNVASQMIPDMMIIDFQMSDMDAFQFCRLVKGEYFELLNKTPVVIVSDKIPAFLGELIAYEVGAFHFIPMEDAPPKILSLLRLKFKNTDLTTSDKFRLDPRIRALAVDDQKDSLKILEYYLKREGYLFMGAGDLNSTLEKLEIFDPDVILLDYELPEIKGLDILQKILEKKPDAVVIMLTAHGSPEIALKSIELGAADYLTKKNITETLHEKIKSVLMKKQFLNLIEKCL